VCKIGPNQTVCRYLTQNKRRRFNISNKHDGRLAYFHTKAANLPNTTYVAPSREIQMMPAPVLNWPRP
jgi:hypothetical protein